MNLRAVLFDLDDTLHDKSATSRAVAAKQYVTGELSSLGISESEWESQYVDLNNLRIEKTEVFSRLRDRFSLPSGLAASLLADFDNNLGTAAKAYAGALDLVRSCKAQDMKVGLVTNGRDAFQRSKIVGMGVAENMMPWLPRAALESRSQIYASFAHASRCSMSSQMLLHSSETTLQPICSPPWSLACEPSGNPPLSLREWHSAATTSMKSEPSYYRRPKEGLHKAPSQVAGH